MHAATIALPASVRAILARWAEPCDPALRPDGQAAAAAAMYRSLSLADPGTAVLQAQLARILHDARYNRDCGQFAELRREGEQLVQWVCAVLATGPAPQHIFIPY